MDRQINNDKAEQILEAFNEWIEENAPKDMMKWAKRCLPYEHHKVSYFGKRIRRCASKGWLEGLPGAIEGYKDFVGRIKKEWDRMRKIWARLNDSHADGLS